MRAVPFSVGATVLGAPLLTATMFLASGAAEPLPPVACRLQLPPTVSQQADTGRGAGTTSRRASASPTELTHSAGATRQEVGDDDQTVLLLAEQVATARALVDAATAAGLDERSAASAVAVSWEKSALLSLSTRRPAPGSDHWASGANPAEDLRRLLQQGARPGQQSEGAGGTGARPGNTADGAEAGSTYAAVASALTHALWPSGRTTALRCGPATNGGVTPGGSAGLLPQACSVRPDPTTGRGCLTPRTAVLAAQLLAGGWRVSCWDPHLWNPSSDHPQGRACDVAIGRPGRFPGAEDKARGNALAGALQAGAADSGVDYLIWSGRIWSSASATQGWRPYSGGGVYDADSPTGGHYDHVHLSVQ